jgi:hypothetical protein
MHVNRKIYYTHSFAKKSVDSSNTIPKLTEIFPYLLDFAF